MVAEGEMRPGRARRLMRRYVTHHLHLSRPGPELVAPDGAVLGRVRRIMLESGFWVVEGWARAAQVRLQLGDRWQTATPRPGPNGAFSFRLALPFTREPSWLLVTPLGAADQPGPALPAASAEVQPFRTDLPPFGAAALALQRAALVPQFGLRVLRAVPALRDWSRSRDAASRARLKRALGLGIPGGRPLSADALSGGATPAAADVTAPVVIVLPVHDGPDLLAACLDRVVRNSDLPWRLVVVDDASPDPRIRPALREFAASRPPGQVRLLENDRNLGFIGSVNRALEVVREPDAGEAPAVVLLNSDAMVPPGWLGRLLAPMLAAPEQVASVTPMSNDAELLTAPVICAPLALRAGEGEAIDAAAQRLADTAAQVDLPTGVGFCMAVNPRFLARIPTLDPAFGRGYGEEVDWCRKATRMGGRHLAQPRLFVEHLGAGSFGTAEKERLIRENGEIVSARYPEFDEEVQSFLTADPLVTQRLALALGFAAARAGQDGGQVPLWLGHSLGGGAEMALAREVAQAVRDFGAGVVLRVGGQQRWRIEVHCAAGITSGESDDRALVMALLSLLPRRRVIYSCAVGDTDPVELPRLLLELAQGEAQRLEIRLHDYFPLSPAPTLLGRDARYRGVPGPAAADPAHGCARADGRPVTPAEWQGAWGDLARRADEVTAYSEASAAIAAEAWPFLGPRLKVRPHDLPMAVPRIAPPGPAARPVIGILGNLGVEKGAGLTVALARRLRQRRLRAGVVVLGEVDPAFRLPRGLRVHGGYRPEEIPALARRYAVTCWLIPSIWPETFSFTTHEALASGLPVWCFDLGAQGDAVRKAVAEGAPGGVIALAPGAAPDPDAVIAAILGGQEAARA